MQDPQPLFVSEHNPHVFDDTFWYVPTAQSKQNLAYSYIDPLLVPTIK